MYRYTFLIYLLYIRLFWPPGNNYWYWHKYDMVTVWVNDCIYCSSSSYKKKNIVMYWSLVSSHQMHETTTINQCFTSILSKHTLCWYLLHPIKSAPALLCLPVGPPEVKHDLCVQTWQHCSSPAATPACLSVVWPLCSPLGIHKDMHCMTKHTQNK